MAKLRTPVRWRNASVAGACAIVALLPFAGRAMVGPAVNDKLTTVLADLAAAVPQEQGPIAQERTGAIAQLSPDALPESVHDALQGRHLRMNARNEVQVYILLDAVNDDHLRQLAAEGVTVEIEDAPHRRVQARVPVGRLQAVTQLQFVNLVRQPTYAVHRAGAALTEGDAILRANLARQQFGLDGTGVKVGVISDGLKGVFATGCTTCGAAGNGPISTGDLPNATGTRNAAGTLTSSSGGITGRSFATPTDLEGRPPTGCAFAGAGAEGTALLEVVHDIAPGAQLAFANADTDLAFNSAVNYLAQSNDIVMDDLGFYGEATDGTSPVSTNTAAALNNNANRIRTYITANGNAADEHYIGTYADSGIDGTSIAGITSGGHLHRFGPSGDTVDVLNRGAQPYNLISLPRSGEVVIFLTWDDPFGGSRNNYDLYLVRDSTNTVVARSTSAQSGTQDPLEFIDYTDNVTTQGSTEYFRIVIQNVNGAAQPKLLNLFSYEPQCAADGPRLITTGRHERHSYNTATRSVAAQNDAGGSPVSVISVGAICSGSAAAISATRSSDESCTDASHSTIEFFSSQGPTLDGRTKPDVSAIDGVSVTGAGQFPSTFFGTSAAAPHVAGLAALLLQATPCLVAGSANAADVVGARTTLRDLIVSNAVPLAGHPPDNVFGSGRADALNSVQKTVPDFSGPSAVTVGGNTPTGASITGTQLGFPAGAQCMVASGGCSSAGVTISCPFGTSTTTVTAGNNALVGSAQHSVQVTVTDFAVAAAPASATVTAGQSATYQVTVSSQGGAFPSAVTLGCGTLPAGASCSFNPPSITPGTGSATSTVTISTTGAATLSGASMARPACPLPPRVPRVPPALAALAVGLAVIAVRRAVVRPHDATEAGGSPSLRFARAGAFPLAAGALALVIGQVACGSSSPPPSQPAVTLSSSSLTFAAQGLQTTSASQTVTLTNSGQAALSITSISATGDFAQTNTCGTSVAAGGSCAIAVTFTPTAAGGRAGTVSIADNATGSPHTIALTGTGQARTPADKYSVAITGSSGTLVHSAAVTLEVR